MTSAALLPTPGDPYRALYWLRHLATWRDEVDELWVLSSGQPDEVARAAIRQAVHELGGVCVERDHLVPHGVALGVLVQDCAADLLLLCEDDAFVREPGAVADHLNIIRRDEADVVASPRHSMSPELAAAAVTRWGFNVVTADGSTGHGMWPAFVFASRDVLLATDRNYSNWSWGCGQRVPGLDHVVTGETAVTDTFGSAAFQLRARFRVQDVPQFKGPWRWREWLDGGARIPWFHVGSLSSSANLLAAEPDFMDGRTMEGQELGEWGHRLHWWWRAFRATRHLLPGEHGVRYERNLRRLANRVGVIDSDMDAWAPLVDRLVTWEEK